MTGKQINQARRINRVIEESEKDEIFKNLVQSYGKLIFELEEIKTENKLLRAENRMLFDIIKEGRR